MKNLVTYEMIGEEFMYFLGIFTPDQADTIGFDFISKSMFDGVKLHKYSSDLLLELINNNAKSISYVTKVNKDTRYITEDSCHNIVGYRYLSDLNDGSNVRLVLRKLGQNLISFYENPETANKLPEFLEVLVPRVMSNLVTMTKEYMRGEADNISDDVLRAIWGEENNQTNAEWLVSLDEIMMDAQWGDDDNPAFEEYIYANVLVTAQGNVYGIDTPLGSGVISDICKAVSARTWGDIVRIWSGDENLINEIRIECGITEPEKSVNINLCGVNWIKELRSFTPDPERWWKVGNFNEGDLWMNNLDGEMALIISSDKILKCYI